jgi:hypothetical protein
MGIEVLDNSIEWPFLESVLLELGFPFKFLGWIMACLCVLFNSHQWCAYCSLALQLRE